MVRYSVVENKKPREIVLLKGHPCIWGRCAFCDYIDDNSKNEEEMAEFNSEVLKNVTGFKGVLEVINSGSVFELPKKTLFEIKEIVKEKGIKLLFFESYWSYRDRLDEMRQFFGVPIIFKNGVETFNDYFRNNVLKKGTVFSGPEEVAKYFDSICLMVGIQGQTKEMIDYDMECLQEYFKHGCVNVFIDNTTNIKADNELIKWFRDKYSYLDENPNIEVLWNNTDFGVGGTL
ncbi:radical SAM protein [Tyzzerella sp. An114]|nr:radical SAM protein [Tyzzerella sp. An114]